MTSSMWKGIILNKDIFCRKRATMWFSNSFLLNDLKRKKGDRIIDWRQWEGRSSLYFFCLLFLADSNDLLIHIVLLRRLERLILGCLNEPIREGRGVSEVCEQLELRPGRLKKCSCMISRSNGRETVIKLAGSSMHLRSSDDTAVRLSV